MHESVGVRADLYKRAEIKHPHDGAFQSLAHHVLAREVVNFFERRVRGSLFAGNENGAVLFNRDVIAKRPLADSVDGFPAGADDETDLVNLNFNRKNLRSTRADIGARSGKFFFNNSENF